MFKMFFETQCGSSWPLSPVVSYYY